MHTVTARILLLVWISLAIPSIRAQTLLWSCNFDEGRLCDGGVQDNTDPQEWVIRSTFTQTEGTGPSSAQSPPTYFYLETSDPVKPGEDARFTSPDLNTVGLVCVDFYYHMWDDERQNEKSMGTLNLYTQEGSFSNTRRNTDFSVTGNQGNNWIRERITLQLPGRAYRVGWQAIKGANIRSDIAVDTITITSGSCDGAPSADQSTTVPPENSTAETTPTMTSTSVTVVTTISNGGTTAITSSTTTATSIAGVNTTSNASSTAGPGASTTSDEGIASTTVASVSSGGDPATEATRPETTPTTPAVVALPFTCGFESSDLCQFRQSPDDRFDWTRQSGRTTSDNTGPNSARSGEYYVYTEASSPRIPGDHAILVSPGLDATGQACVTFYYYMYGSSIRNLQVSTNRRIDTPYLTITGDQGQAWKEASVTVDLNRGDAVTFRGSVGTSAQSDIAIDDVEIRSGACPDQQTTTAIPNTGSLPYTCSFESSDLCQMVQRTNDHFNWDRQSGPTGTSETGPERAAAGEYYIYIEASTPRVPNDLAVIETPSIQYTGDICVQFQYHMYGAAMGRLLVTQSSRTTPLLDESGNKGNQWNSAALDAYIQSGEKIVFSGYRGSEIQSDISIDDLRITQGKCPGSITGKLLPYYCTFESEDLCDMVQLTNDQFDWTRQSGGTPTDGTGPDRAAQGEYYIYTEVSDPRVQGDRAIIETPALDATGSVCIRFSYHLNGERVSRLRVTQTGVSTPLLDISTSQGNQWNSVSLNADLRRYDKITFEVTRGEKVYGDVAIDDLQIVYGSCGGAEPVTTTTTTTTTARPPPPSSNLPWSCTFEYDVCNMEQMSDNDVDWARQSGGTATQGTGPDSAVQGSYYIYAETSAPQVQGDRSVIRTPELDTFGTICIEFQYHMNGQSVGQFYVRRSGSTDQLFISDTSKGNQWNSVKIDTNIQRYERVEFTAIRGSGIYGDVAIDDVRISQGSCSGTVSPTEPPSIQQFATMTCDIERDGSSTSGCRVTQDRSDTFDWLRNSGKTPSGSLHDRRLNGVKYPVTGPSGASQGSYYLYVEATGRRNGDLARVVLDGDDFRRSGSNCLRYSYNMNGFHSGTLRTYVIRNGVRTYPWTMKGDQGEAWKQAAVDINMDGVSEVGLEATVTGEFSSDMAVDSISMSSGRCESIPSEYLWRCRFETSDGASSLCGMSQASNDQFDWTLWTGSTDSEETGPDRAYEGAFYIYIEASKPRQSGDTARILVPDIDYNGDVCVEFFYHMYGWHIGTLELFTRSPTGSETKSWEIQGQQGNNWREQRQTVENLQRGYQIGFAGRRAGEYSGDIALDNIRIRRGRC